MYKFPLEKYQGRHIIPPENETLEYFTFFDQSLNNMSDYRIVFDSCKFEKVDITNNLFNRSEFVDCTFINCDLSNNHFTASTFVRCIFKECKFTGSHFIECFLSNILISKSTAQYLDIADSKIQILRVEDTILSESNWFENKIKDISFHQNDLTKAHIYKNPFNDIDISSCNIDSMQIDLMSLKGMKIAPWQAEAFCNLLGLKITQ